MKVSGKKVSTGKHNLTCQICEDHESSTHAYRYCGECEKSMCKTCFDTHKKSIEVIEEDLEKCDRHFKEKIKFYCLNHEQVGCGDCMILKHKMCKIEYIKDMARTFKDSPEFKDLVKGAEKCHAEAKKMLSFIKNNKVQIIEINEKFNQDVNMLKDKIMSHVTEMQNTMLRQGRGVMKKDIERMQALEKAIEGMINELLILTDEFESQTDRPNKLFISSILQKTKLERLRDQLDRMRSNNKIQMYEVKCDDNLEHLVEECKQFGSLQRIKQRSHKNLQEEEEEVRPNVQAAGPRKPQVHLHDVMANYLIIDI